MRDSAYLGYVYDDGGRSKAGRTGSAGDCVVRAIAIVTGQSYQEVYDRLAQGNANQRIGKRQSMRTRGVRSASNGVFTSRRWFKDYMRWQGFKWTPTMSIGSGCQVHMCADELPMGKLILSVSRHYVAVIDKVIYDTYDPSRGTNRCVYGYWSL